jgi:glutamate racemase
LFGNIFRNNIGVIGTKATISSGIYERKIEKLCSSAKINSLATPLLAPMIEEEFINEAISNTVIANYLSNKKLANIDHLILACTHYPLIQQKIKDYYKGSVNVIDSANIVAKYIAKQLKEDDLLNNVKSTEHHLVDHLLLVVWQYISQQYWCYWHKSNN